MTLRDGRGVRAEATDEERRHPVGRALRGPDRQSAIGGNVNTKAEAKRAWQEQESAIRRRTWIAPEVSGQTFDQYVDSMFWPHRVPRLAATSLADDERLLRLHLRPYFGGRQMDSIRHSVVQTWVTERLSVGAQPARIREAHTLLHTILNAAIKDGVLSGENACRFTDLPNYQRREMRILTPEEYDAILSEMPGAFRLIVRTLLEETGCRWSELVGLRLCDVQFLHRRVLIRQAIVENSGNPNRWVVKDTKGKRERAISVSPEWLDEVAQHIGREGLGEEDLLFALTVPADPLGAAKPVDGTTARARAWARENGIRVGTHGRLRPEVPAACAAQ